jgi:predicted DNA-binding ArsR family transcriptional regulator
MSLVIKSIVIYNSKGDTRTLAFNESGMNIITGNSGTGKTSIADIIIYCLGGDFDVKGKIRDVIEWYGLHLKLNDQEVFLARKKPPQGQSKTNVCHFVVGKTVNIPSFDELDGKDSIESATGYLSKAIGISANLLKPRDGSTLTPAEPSLKHALYYNFQKQSTIANEKVLFHRQDEQFIGNYIRLTAPYFIGAIPEDQIAKKVVLAELKRQLRQVELEIQEVQSVIGKGTSRGLALLNEAEALDLLDVPDEPSDLNKLVSLLKGVSWDRMESVDRLPQDALAKLHLERDSLIESYNNLRAEFEIATKFQKDQSGYSNETGEQKNRLQSIELFKVFSTDSECPGCGRDGIDFSNIATDVKTSFDQLNTQIELVSNSRTKLDGYVEELREKVIKNKEAVKIANSNIVSVNRQNDELSKSKNLDRQKAKVFGRISLYLESIEIKKDIGSLIDKRDELSLKVKNLEEELDFETMEDIFESQLSFINRVMSDWSKVLMKENAGLDYRLNFSRLTVEAMTENGPIAMSKMGSGQNWLGCHLMAYFSLHKWFLEKKRPVPSFLFLDQPTQVWFPAEMKGTDEDFKAVRALFAWLYKVTKEIPGMQVILVDHVNFNTDEEFKKATVEIWRDGNALVPNDWMK